MQIKKLVKNQSGQTLATVALMLPVLCGALGLGIDVANFFLLKRRMQTAVDAAVVAAVQEMKRNNPTQLTAAALNGAARNGFNGSHGDVIRVNHPPASGPQAGNADFIEVTITQVQPTLFTRLLGLNSATVQSRAVGSWNGAIHASCIYVLHPTASNAFVASGSASVNSDCGIYINSTNSKAMVVSGGACVTAGFVKVTGNYSGSCITPHPQTGAAAVADPLAGLQPPAFGGCNYTNKKVTGTQTLNPGVYCGGIEVPSGGHAILNPGVYILAGGGLTVSGGGILEGQGVGFYNTAIPGYDYKPITVSGGSPVTLSAPTSGPLAGVIFFQDRSIVTSSKNTVSGGSSTKLEGTLYFPTTKLVFSGGGNISSPSHWTIIIANLLEFSGSSWLDDDYTNSVIPVPPGFDNGAGLDPTRIETGSTPALVE